MRNLVFAIIGAAASLAIATGAYAFAGGEAGSIYLPKTAVTASHSYCCHHRHYHHYHHYRRCYSYSNFPTCGYCPCCPAGCYGWDPDASPLDNFLGLGLWGGVVY